MFFDITRIYDWRPFARSKREKEREKPTRKSKKRVRVSRIRQRMRSPKKFDRDRRKRSETVGGGRVAQVGRGGAYEERITYEIKWERSRPHRDGDGEK